MAIPKIDSSCKAHGNLILKESMLSIDPGSKQVGWAYWEKGEMIESGVIKADPKNEVWYRARELFHQLHTNFPYVEVLAVEHIALGMARNSLLLMTTGMIFSAVDSDVVIMVAPASWKKYRGEDYTKTDENDAITIGKCVVEKAKELNP